MQNYNATFLVGVPGSGKDFILHNVLKESNAIELPFTKLIAAITTNQNLEEVNGQPLIINGNADDSRIITSKAVLEAMGYTTSMVFVYTDNQVSSQRCKIVESRRVARYDESMRLMHIFKESFKDGFFLFDNSNDFNTVNEETQDQIVIWIEELSQLVESYFEKKSVLGIRSPKVPKPVGGEPKGGHPVPAGYERIKDGAFYKLRKIKESHPKPIENQDDTQIDGTGLKEEIDILFEKEYPTIVDMIAQKKDTKGTKQGDKYKGGISVPGNKATSREVVETNQEISVPQTQVKGVKYSKNRPAKGAKDPGEPYDSRIGTVPSGGIGLTAYHVDEVQPKKTLKQLREKKE